MPQSNHRTAMSYRDRLCEHLANYKKTRLGVVEDGVWRRNGRAYPHILPQRLQGFNILETARAEFWEYRERTGVGLHGDFHHLNSSQAMCFNLFFPFLGMDARGLPVLLECLGLPIEPFEPARNWSFEHIVDKNEGTNLDLFVEGRADAPGARAFFELKLSECDFGRCRDDTRHRDKLSNIYKPRLSTMIEAEWLEGTNFFANYQFFRNVWHLERENDWLVIVAPAANAALGNRAKVLSEAVLEQWHNRILFVSLEDLVANLRCRCGDNAILTAHLALFAEKYVLPIVEDLAAA